MNLTDAKTHLQKLFENIEGYIELRIFSKDFVKPIFFDSIDECIRYLQSNLLDNCDVCVGVNPRTVKPWKGGGRAEHIDKCHFLFADIDFKETIESKQLDEDILKKLDEQGYFKDDAGVAYVKEKDKIYRIFKPDKDTFVTALITRLKSVGIEDISLIIDSGWGYHIYLKLRRPLQRDAWSKLQKSFVRFLNADPQATDSARVLRLAGSFNNKFSHVKVPCKIVYVSDYSADPEELGDLLRERDVEVDGDGQESEFAQRGGRRLSPEQKEQLVKLFLQYWDEGRRHALSLMISGALYWHDYCLEDAVDVVREICLRSKDEEAEDRIRAIEDTYARGASGKDIAYKSNDIRSMMTKKLSQDEFEFLVTELLRIIGGSFIVSKDSIFVRKSENTLIVADRRSCMIKEMFVRQANGETRLILRDVIATLFPEEVVVVQEDDAEFLKIKFRTSDGAMLSIEGDLEELATHLKKMTIRVTSRKKLEDALSLIVSKMVSVGVCKKINGENVQGILLKDGKIIGVDFDTTMPSKDELREALILLDEFARLSEFSQRRIEKISLLVKWFVVSGLGWIYKQLGAWIPHCYLYGEADTGKTASALFLSNIWWEPLVGSLGTIDSPYRFGAVVSQSTFPAVINEMSFEDLGSDVLELWKNSVDGKIVRSRYGKKIKAYSTLCFTSNSHVPTERSIRKRLCIIVFDMTDSNVLLDPKNKRKFEEILRERCKLRAIGRFVVNWVSSHLEDLKRFEWEYIAEAILKDMYSYAGLDVPVWVTLKNAEDEDDPISSKAEEIRAYIIDRFTKVGLLRAGLIPNEDDFFVEAHYVIPWLHYRNDNSVIITRAIIKELSTVGIRVVNLRDLSYYIPNSEYKAKLKLGNTVRSGIVVSSKDFFEWLGLKLGGDETDENDDNGDDGNDGASETNDHDEKEITILMNEDDLRRKYLEEILNHDDHKKSRDEETREEPNTDPKENEPEKTESKTARERETEPEEGEEGGKEEDGKAKEVKSLDTTGATNGDCAYVPIIVTEDVPPIAGVDGRTYELKKGGEYVIPAPNAKILLKNGVARLKVDEVRLFSFSRLTLGKPPPLLPQLELGKPPPRGISGRGSLARIVDELFRVTPHARFPRLPATL